MTTPIKIPIGENRIVDIATVWHIESFVSKKQLTPETGELPRYVSLYVIRLYIDSSNPVLFKMAYFVDEYQYKQYWDWLIELLKDKLGLVMPPFKPFKKLERDVSMLFFGHKTSQKKTNHQKEEELHKQLAEARETLKHVSPDVAAISEEMARQKDEAQKRKQDNDSFFNNFLSKKKRLGSSIRRRYQVTDDDINKDLNDMAKAAANHYHKKSKNNLPVPDELGFGDEEDL